MHPRPMAETVRAERTRLRVFMKNAPDAWMNGERRWFTGEIRRHSIDVRPLGRDSGLSVDADQGLGGFRDIADVGSGQSQRLQFTHEIFRLVRNERHQ